MLRYKTETRPGLVALYDIRPGNGAGPFLQPRSPHRAQYKGHLDLVEAQGTVRCNTVLIQSLISHPWIHGLVLFLYLSIDSVANVGVISVQICHTRLITQQLKWSWSLTASIYFILFYFILFMSTYATWTCLVVHVCIYAGRLFSEYSTLCIIAVNKECTPWVKENKTLYSCP